MKTPEQMAEEYLDQDKVACDAIDHAAEDLVKDAFLAGYQAAENQLGDAGKVVNFSNNSKGWISFKDQLPTIGKQILIVYNVGDGIEMNQGSRWPEDPNNPDAMYPWYFCQSTIFGAEHALYWMPLPEPPKEDK